MSTWRPCALIPVYNHGATAGLVVGKLVEEGLSVILVDDGSNEETKKHLNAIVQNFSGTLLFTLPKNLGKGGAVAHGLMRAYEAGFSHALQVDADGQHDIGDVREFLEESRRQPELLIGGRPVYDQTVPRGRLIGRKITNFFVAVETISRAIPDAMCGFRMYPLEPCYRLLSRKHLSQRMAFDIEILIRLYWQGVNMRFKPVKVVYPEGGLSHFRMLSDNLAISGIHTVLTFGMLVRLPVLVFRRRS